MESQIFEVLQGSLSAEPNTRMRSELTLKQLGQSVEFPLAAATVATTESLDVSIRQAAIVQIREYVSHHWSIGSNKYEPGPIPDQTIKSQVRQQVFSLLSSPERKVRMAAAAVISSMARYDWPDEWPQLFDQLVELLRNGTRDQVHAAMCVFNEWVTNEMSEQNIDKLGSLLPELKRIFVNGSYDTDTRVMAVAVFGDCIDIISNMAFTQTDFVDTHTPPMLKDWMEPILGVLQEPISKEMNVPLKAECARAVIKMTEGFAKHMAPYNTAILESMWAQLQALCEPFACAFVYDDGERTEAAVELLTASDSEEAASVDGYLLGIFEWLSKATERKSMRKFFISKNESEAARPTPFFVQLSAVLMSYAQITAEMIADWDDDMDLFVADEDEEGYRFNVRVSVQELVQSLIYAFPRTLPMALWEAARQHIEVAQQWKQQGNANWWLVSEAVLWAIGLVASTLVEQQQEGKKAMELIDLGALFETTVWPLARSAEFPFGQGRAFIFASSFAKVLPTGIAEAFVEASSKAAAGTDMHAAVRLSAVRAIGNLSRYLASDLVKPHQALIISGLADIIPQLSEDSAHIALDALQATLKVDQATTAALEPAISQAIIGMWQKFPGDVLLTNIIIDIVEDMARNEHVYAEFSRRALPVIGNAITTSTEGMVVASAIDLLAGLVKGGPSPMPEGYTEAIFPSLMQVLETSADSEVLQSGQACLKYFVQKDAERIVQWRDSNGVSGLDHIIRLVARLLSPDASESSALFVGDLVAKIIQKCGQFIAGGTLAELIRVVTTRLATARTSSFCASLLPLYAQLVVHHAAEVVDLLASMEFGEQNGLQVVLAAWFKNYSDVQGYYSRKVSAVALTRLFALGDGRVLSFVVQGDLVPNTANAGKIVTRSMARVNPDQYTQVPASAKIVKLLLGEMGADLEASYARVGAAMGAADDGEDDGEWEDDGDDDYDDDILNELAPADQYGDLSDLIDGGFDEGDDDDDDQDVVNDPIYTQDLNEALGTFFCEAVPTNQGLFHDVIKPTLNAKELAMLAKILPH